MYFEPAPQEVGKMENNEKQLAITFTLPNPKVGIILLAERINQLFLSVYNPFRSNVRTMAESGKLKLDNLSSSGFSGRNFNKKKIFKYIFPVVVVVLIAGAVFAIANRLPDASKSPVVANGEGVDVPKPISTIGLNRTVDFPLRDDKGKDVGKFGFTIQNAELRKQIIVKGKRATAVNERVFLILNLKVSNNLSQPMELPTRNFMRVVVNNNDAEMLAPDIHNDPVEVLAKSTKYTRLGLAINAEDSKKPIKLLVGEIDGEKQTIDLQFK